MEVNIKTNLERKKQALINGIFFLVTLVVNALGATGKINGLSQKDISDRYITLITPSPSTFSIWSLIYILLLASILMMIFKQDDPYYQKAIDEISFLFRLSSLLNIAWIVLFSYLFVELSVIFILGFAVTLSLISLKLLKMQTSKRWLLPLTFGLYTGWLMIATVVNIAAALVKLEWGRFGVPEDIWAFIILAVAVGLVVLVLLRIENASFPLPVAWAYFGIYQFLNSQDGFKGEYELLQTVALVGCAVLIGAAAVQLYRNRFQIVPIQSEL